MRTALRFSAGPRGCRSGSPRRRRRRRARAAGPSAGGGRCVPGRRSAAGPSLALPLRRRLGVVSKPRLRSYSSRSRLRFGIGSILALHPAQPPPRLPRRPGGGERRARRRAGRRTVLPPRREPRLRRPALSTSRSSTGRATTASTPAPTWERGATQGLRRFSLDLYGLHVTAGPGQGRPARFRRGRGKLRIPRGNRSRQGLFRRPDPISRRPQPGDRPRRGDGGMDPNRTTARSRSASRSGPPPGCPATTSPTTRPRFRIDLNVPAGLKAVANGGSRASCRRIAATDLRLGRRSADEPLPGALIDIGRGQLVQSRDRRAADLDPRRPPPCGCARQPAREAAGDHPLRARPLRRLPVR